jgi:hypothetical protein
VEIFELQLFEQNESPRRSFCPEQTTVDDGNCLSVWKTKSFDRFMNLCTQAKRMEYGKTKHVEIEITIKNVKLRCRMSAAKGLQFSTLEV